MQRFYWALKYEPKGTHSKPYTVLYKADDFSLSAMRWLAKMKNERNVTHNVYFWGQMTPEAVPALRTITEIKFFDGEV